jgi:hypothetical protein
MSITKNETMKRSFDFEQPAAPRRPLKIYAFDPMIGRRQGGRIVIDIPNETDLEAGPKGKRIRVIDYDGANDVFYSPVNLDDPAILMQNGLEPTESDRPSSRPCEPYRAGSIAYRANRPQHVHPCVRVSPTHRYNLR